VFATQTDLIRDILARFEARDVEPDESTIRRKITPV
jgi:hypothetical protein